MQVSASMRDVVEPSDQPKPFMAMLQAGWSALFSSCALAEASQSVINSLIWKTYMLLAVDFLSVWLWLERSISHGVYGRRIPGTLYDEPTMSHTESR